VAVEETGDERRDNRARDRLIYRVVPRHHHAANHAGQRKQRTDRQVDAAGRDHGGHAEPDDADKSAVAGDVEKVLRGEEGRARKAQIDEGENRGDEDPEGLAREELANRAMRLAIDRFLEGGDGHVGASFPLVPQAVSIAPWIRPVTSSGELSVTTLSATLRPRLRTTMRSATANTSGMRWLMRTTAIPPSRRCRIRFKTSAT